MGRRTLLRGQLFVIWILVLISLYFMVFPRHAFTLATYLPFIDENLFSEEAAVRVFTGVNTLLVIFLSTAGGALRQAMKTPTSLDALGISLPTPESIRSETYAEPCHVVLIFDDLQSYKNKDSVIRSIKRSAILGNLKPIFINQKSQFRDFIKEGRVLAILADDVHYEEFTRYLSGSSITYIGLQNRDKVQASASAQKISICAPDRLWKTEEEYEVASALSTLHSFDTPRGVGFHGNWAGTYGLLAYHQDNTGTVEGVYWYGNGQMKGKCSVDEENERLVLNYEWSQKENVDGVGSSFRGDGIFVIPAGFEFFYGFWYDKDNPSSSQSWVCGRVSRDITDDVLNGGPYAKDLGLSQHSLEYIVRW